MEKIPAKKVELSGQIQWPRLRIAQAEANNGDYSFDLCQLSADSKAALEAAGVEVRKGTEDKEYKGDFVKVKSKLTDKFTSQKYFSVYHEGVSVDPEELNIGNGTEAYVKCSVKPYSYQGKDGHTVYFNSVLITKMVEFTADGNPWEGHPANN